MSLTRRDERRSLPLLIQYRFDRDPTFHTSYSINISSSGLYLQTLAPPAIGSTVHLQFILRGGAETIRCRARVVRVENGSRKGQPAGCGVQFTDLDELDLAEIVEQVEDHNTATA